MPKCSARKEDGKQCERIVGATQTYCFAHDPQEAEARSRHASVAAKAKGAAPHELREVKRQLRQLYRDVQTGDVDPRLGAALVSIANSLQRAISLEAELNSTADLGRRLHRIEEMERQVKQHWVN